MQNHLLRAAANRDIHLFVYFCFSNGMVNEGIPIRPFVEIREDLPNFFR